MSGTVERLKSGRYRARKKNAAGKYVALGTYDTEQEATLALRRPIPVKGGVTLSEIGEEFLLRRRKEIRDWANGERYWRLYIEREPVARHPLKELKRKHVKGWMLSLAERGLAAQTQRNALNLLRVALGYALDEEYIHENPARDVRLSKRASDEEPEDKWEILYPDEQLALLSAVPEDEWHTVAFALGLGLRNTEQWTLRISDIDLEGAEVAVRGWKTSKLRRVPLFGLAHDAAREALDRQKRKCEWAFPSPRDNKRRAAKSHPSAWHRWVEDAGIKRRIRWYDLRHTCATSLLAGWWGKQWTLPDIAGLLGHASIKTTERYAHRLNETLRRAAQGTGFHGELGKSVSAGANYEIRTRDLRFTNPRTIQGFSGLAVEEFRKRSTRRDDQLAAIILEGARLVYRGDALAKARLRELCQRGAEILDSGEAHAAGVL